MRLMHELQSSAWVDYGNANGYYRDIGTNGEKKVILAIPRHNSRIWHDTHEVRTEDFNVVRRPGAEPARTPEMEMLTI